MGKAKRERLREKGRFDPSAEPVTIKEDHTPTVPILEKLESTSAEEREAACSSVSHLCLEGPDAVKTLMAAQVVPKLLQRFFDGSKPVRIAAFGALRNLSLVGKDVCSEIVGHDVMNSVVILLRKCAEDLTLAAVLSSDQSNPEATEERKENILMLTQVFALLWNLCQDSPQATEAFSKQSDVHALALDAFSRGDFPLVFRVTVGHFLTVATDANNSPELHSGPLAKPEATVRLQQLLEPSQPAIISAQAACVLCNLWFAAQPTETVQNILPTIARVMKTDVHGTILQNAVAALHEEHRKQQMVEGAELKITDISEDPEAVEVWRNETVAQQLGIEILTNFLADNSDENESDGGDVDMDEVAHGDRPNTHIQPYQIVSLTATVSDLLRVLAAMPATPSLPSTLTLRLVVLRSLRLRALACLTNALATAGTQTFLEISQTNPQQLWNGLWNIIVSCLDQTAAVATVTDLETSQTCLEVLWTLTRDAAPNIRHVTVDPTQLKVLCELSCTSPQEEIRVTCSGLLGVVGNRPFDAALHLVTAQALSQVVQGDASVIVVCEALNAIFDVFAEPEYNPPFHQVGMLDLLRQTAGNIGKRAKQQKLSRDEREHVSETVANVKSFIVYKQKQP